MTTCRIMVELDTLLDTRLATVSKLHAQAATGLLGPHYFQREIDDFELLTQGLITNEAYKEAYAARDVDTLKRSLCTEATLMLNDLVAMTELHHVTAVDFDRLIVEVNTHPYVLTEDMRELMITAIMAYAGCETEVRLMDMSLEDLTPALIKERYAMVMLYDFNAWLVRHQRALIDISLPKVRFIVPALFIKQPKEDERYFQDEGTDRRANPFELMEFAMLQKLKLEMLKPEIFSLVQKRA